MIKLLIFILIIYVGYRLFSGKPLLDQRKMGRIQRDRKDDDYTDYEEIR